MTGIGLVGLGRMGIPMCANLVRAGYRVQAADRRSEAAALAARCGAHWVPQMSQLAAESDVLITVLPGAGEVREVMLGPGGMAEALLLGQASGLDLGVLRETLTRSAADSQFIRQDLDALFAGDYMRSFGLDRCYQELQILTERARDLGVPFQLSKTVADIYGRAVRRYGAADGELLGIALLEEQAGSQLRHV
jgi:3-hydroxyisobutyrate dehydrogenase-like beta-hydroxyacid dehydrogenase